MKNKSFSERFLKWAQEEAKNDTDFTNLAGIIRGGAHYYESDEVLGLLMMYAFTLKENKVRKLSINTLVENIKTLEEEIEEDSSILESEDD